MREDRKFVYSWHIRSCFEMVPEFYYAEFSRRFRLWKRERGGGYVTDDKDENGRKGRVRKERNYFKTASKTLVRIWKSRKI